MTTEAWGHAGFCAMLLDISVIHAVPGPCLEAHPIIAVSLWETPSP